MEAGSPRYHKTGDTAQMNDGLMISQQIPSPPTLKSGRMLEPIKENRPRITGTTDYQRIALVSQATCRVI